MRFRNWDVLIFPASDATPIQEFTTEFCNIPDPGLVPSEIKIFGAKSLTCSFDFNIDYAFLSKMALADIETSGKEDSKFLPTVSTYIPMLVPGTPFQISIHSWTAPQVSGNIEPGSHAMVEARLFIDGVPITYVVCPASSSWPMVVDSYPVNSAFGTRKRNLTFPAFNQDSLNQWANGDTELGRIKIVISEGVAGTTVDEGEAGEVSYMRLKNIVCFYYRYAPQELLESVGIYYPTTRKYDNSLARWFPVSIPAHHLASSGSGSPVHRHSPTRKPTHPPNNLPAFDLNLMVPCLEKTAFPNLYPTSFKPTSSDPFCTQAENKHSTSNRTIGEHEHGFSTTQKDKEQIDANENTTLGQVSRSSCQTPITTCLSVLETTLPRMRTDSISSLHSQQSINPSKPEYMEQSSRGKEGFADPSTCKAMRIGIIAETQNQMQLAHPGLPGEDIAFQVVKDFVGKVENARNPLPLVELENIL